MSRLWFAGSRRTKNMLVACSTAAVPSQKFEPSATNFWQAYKKTDCFCNRSLVRRKGLEPPTY